MSDKEKLKLLPCPFCGGKAHFTVIRIMGAAMSYNYGIEFELLCDSCGARKNGIYKIVSKISLNGKLEVVIDDRKRAVEEWNKRI